MEAFLRQTRQLRKAIGFGPVQKNGVLRKGALPAAVVDADALRMLSALPGWPGLLPPGSVLTPHPGEMSALTGLDKETIQKDRRGIAKRFAGEWNAVVVLKGAFTVVAAPDGRTAVEPFATSSLARAGTGDVLAGTIGGLLAQGIESWHAAVLGAYLHGRAGELAAVHAGAADSILARDVALFLSHSIAELRGAV